VSDSTVIDLLVVASIGLLVGTGELISRYRDAPVRALCSPPALVYVSVNLLAACAAYGLITAFNWSFGAASGDPTRWTRVLVAGFGAMALFRSSLFMVRVGGQDVGIGPSSLLAALLAVADRGVDRGRGTRRAAEVHKLLDGIPWTRARTDLPAICLGLMQNATLVEQDALAGAIRDIDAGDLDDDIRVLLVGLELLNLAGAGVLGGAAALVKLDGLQELAPSITGSDD
jgi:hypothetical protein